MALASSPQPLVQTAAIQIGSATITAEVVNTEEARALGLSGRASFKDGEGMLFVFEHEGQWGIWMKDMHFSIDILWLDAAGTVVTVASNVSPETYPESFHPEVPARYVLELPAGYAAKAGIVKGTRLELGIAKAPPTI